jgi:hypothetical protein
MLAAAMTIDAAATVDEALRRLQSFDHHGYVVLRRRSGPDVLYYYFAVQSVRGRLTRTRKRPEGATRRLIDVLALDESDRDQTFQAGESSHADLRTATGILLDGDEVLGVLVPPSVSRGAGSAVSLDDPDLDETLGDENRPVGRLAAFTAFPQLEAPLSVASGKPFDLVIGLSARPPSDSQTGPLEIQLRPTDQEKFDLVVQVVAKGFTAPEGVRRFLHVRRERFEDSRVAVTLVADSITEEAKVATIFVEYSYEGNLCGRAWREIRVTQPGASLEEPDLSEGATGVHTPSPKEAADLTVSITGGERDGDLIWTFTVSSSLSPRDDPLPLPEGQVTSNLGGKDDARAFAEQVMGSIPLREGEPLLIEAMVGTGRLISDAMPVEFWEVLGGVWARAQRHDRSPSLLIISSDPYVPWELASVEGRIEDERLLDANAPPFLGAQLRVGRWVHPRPRAPKGVRWPPLPPSSRVAVDEMVVVVGDYLAESGQRPLPKATDEGKQLARLYGAVRLTATIRDMTRLLRDQLERDGVPLTVGAVHFACHGEVDLRNADYNGIVLSDRDTRLDETVISGTRIGRARQPFAFLNACQLGTSTYKLGNYGGLAGAFLREGFRAFVAPLWAVDDQLAHDIALEFYERTFDEGVSVAEALRRVRAGFDVKLQDGAPPSSYMAYVFYGHPNLVLDKAS